MCAKFISILNQHADSGPNTPSDKSLVREQAKRQAELNHLPRATSHSVCLVLVPYEWLVRRRVAPGSAGPWLAFRGLAAHRGVVLAAPPTSLLDPAGWHGPAARPLFSHLKDWSLPHQPATHINHKILLKHAGLPNFKVSPAAFGFKENTGKVTNAK